MQHILQNETEEHSITFSRAILLIKCTDSHKLKISFLTKMFVLLSAKTTHHVKSDNEKRVNFMLTR